MSKVAILGGGASGIMAAITAARCGSDAVLLEKNSRIGKKLLMTGNGRCNITNMKAEADSYNSAFVCDAIKSFSVSDTLDFFKEIGLLTYVEDEERVYPVTNQASAVLDILRFELERQKVETVCDFDAVRIEKNEKGFVITAKSGKKVTADRVIVAMGGKSAPSTGSDGSGYRLLEQLGHSVKTPEKALVQLKTDKSIKGVRCLCKASLNGKSEMGEVQFTGYGLSGIPIFNLSKYAENGDKVALDVMPQLSETELFEYLKKRDNQPLETYLVGILNKPLGQMLLKECNLGKLTRESGKLEEFEVEKIANKLKNWDFTVTGKMGWDNSQVTSGGIELLEVNPKTMESKIVNGLYISGEILDIDAPCGGFNLQWAWSSGYMAGKNASGA